jgi:hypothetical protein
MTGVGWYSQQISLNFLNLVKFYICKPKSTGRGSLIKKQTICNVLSDLEFDNPYPKHFEYTRSSYDLKNGRSRVAVTNKRIKNGYVIITKVVTNQLSK